MKSKNLLWLYNYALAYRLLIVFTVGWLCFVISDFYIISQRPSELYRPIMGYQKIMMPELPNIWLFLSVVFVALALCVYSFRKKNIILSTVLFLCLMWLNALRWNFGSTSHVGHIFILLHLFSVLTPDYICLNRKVTIYDVSLVKISLSGILVTYTMAGFWKFASLANTIYKGELAQVSWLHKDAVELNAIVNKSVLDNYVSEFMMNLYQVPYFWEISTVIVFIVQLTAILAVVNRTYATIVMLILVLFHLFNTFFNDIVFNVAPLTLIVLLFPYHLVFKTNFNKFKSKFS